MIVERAFDDVGLLNFGMLVHRQCRPRSPLEEAGGLSFLFVFVEHLD